MIPAAHGGRLIERRLSARQADRRVAEVHALPKLWVEVDQLLDADKIGIGAFSPLEGFMDRETLDRVLRDSRLPNSLPWTIPIVLTPPGRRNRSTLDGLRPGDEVALLDPRDRLIAILHFEERFPFEKGSVAQKVYRTTDTAHPNVYDLSLTGDVALAGPIDLVARADSLAPAHELTPEEMRRAFAARHWNNVAAYQTRNVPHRAHEQLQKHTLEREEIDGLLIHPVIGRLKPGDYLPEVVLETYEILLREYLPRDRVLLAALSISMRYAGPRAALFLAIVRKNFGCSHYIVGRDQAGVDGRYDPLASQRIFDELPVGVVPIRYPEMWYCRRCDEVGSPRTCPHSESAREPVSQSRIRRAIREGGSIPAGLLRPEVAARLSRGGRLLNDVAPGPPFVGTQHPSERSPRALRNPHEIAR